MKKRILEKNVDSDWAKRIWMRVAEDATSASIEIEALIGELEEQLTSVTESQSGTFQASTALISKCLALRSFSHFAANEVHNGWQLLTESLEYALCSFKIAYATQFPSVNPQDLKSAAMLYCTALALKSRSVGEWTATFITETALNSNSSLHLGAPNDFLCLCYEFASETCGGRAKREWQYQLEASVYGPLMEAESIEEAQAAIEQLAIDRGTFCSGVHMDNPPWACPPYNLFPVDILAILLMRVSDLVEFDFGCMESPLCHPPAEIDWCKPSLIERIEARVSEMYELPTVDWNA